MVAIILIVFSLLILGTELARRFDFLGSIENSRSKFIGWLLKVFNFDGEKFCTGVKELELSELLNHFNITCCSDHKADNKSVDESDEKSDDEENLILTSKCIDQFKKLKSVQSNFHTSVTGVLVALCFGIFVTVICC